VLVMHYSAFHPWFVLKRFALKKNLGLVHSRHHFDVELRLSPRWVGGNIGNTDATKRYYILNVYIFKIKNRKIINNTSLDSL
jgi:hypothetical protein